MGTLHKCLVGMVGLATLMAGCGDPVVYRPITDPTVQQADMPPKDMIVRTFVGYCESQSDRFSGVRAESVAIVTSGRQPDRGRCRFVFFVSRMAITIDLPLAAPADATNAEFSGKAWDPRGWDVHWTACLKGDLIEGTFKQPNDHGIFRLREVK